MARSGDLGWVGSQIWARGKGLETSQQGESRKELLETEDEGKSSCEKLQVVLGVLLVVAACPNTLLEIKDQAKMPKARFRGLWNMFGPLAW